MSSTALAGRIARLEANILRTAPRAFLQPEPVTPLEDVIAALGVLANAGHPESRMILDILEAAIGPLPAVDTQYEEHAP